MRRPPNTVRRRLVRRHVRRGEQGMAAGGDAFLFGTLILLAGSLVLANLWSVVETRTAVDAAAREYLRAYTRAAELPEAAERAELVARTVLEERGTPLRDLRITAPDPTAFGPCGTASVTLGAHVPAARVPFLGHLGAIDVSVTHTDLVDAHREIRAHERFDPSATACGDGRS